MTVIAIAIFCWLAIWVFGGAPLMRWRAVFSIWAATVLAHLALPEGSFLPSFLGGSARGWAAVGVIGGIIFAYHTGLAAVRRRAVTGPPPRTDDSFQRYARHIFLREIGGSGQMRLKSARVLVIGAGGLGAPALMYLAAAGVGCLGVMDDDDVEESNLQRQIIHTTAAIGTPKAMSAAQSLHALNPHIEIRPLVRRFEPALASLVGDYDLVLDGSDNFDTRYAVNAACVQHQKPLISAAIAQWEGQISLFHPAKGAPCYACLFPNRPAAGLVPSCAEAGVLGPLPGVIGAMMAIEAVKYLTEAGQGLQGKLLIYNALEADWRSLRFARNPACPVCG